MEQTTHEETRPLAGPTMMRMYVPFSCAIEDTIVQGELARIAAQAKDWRSRWVARCLRTVDFRLRLAAAMAPHERQGWHLERFHTVDPTPTGISAILVLEASRPLPTHVAEG